MLIDRTKAEHWYRMEGADVVPCYELPKKSGDGMKAVTLREARELNLLPSVTGILRVLDKPALNDWRVEQGIMAALTLPRLDGEELDAFAKRVVVDMDAQSKKAKGFGTDAHDEIVDRLASGYDEEDLRHPIIGAALHWCRKNITRIDALEQCVGSLEMGVAGRLDFAGAWTGGYGGPNRDCVIDFKTQEVRKTPVFYPEWQLQLAAYAHCYFGATLPEVKVDLVSVIIPKTPCGEVFIKHWQGGDPVRLFQHCVDLWCWQKDYDPRVKRTLL